MKIPDNKEGFDATVGTGCNIDNRNVFINPEEPQPYSPLPAPELDCSIESLLLGTYWAGANFDTPDDYEQLSLYTGFAEF
jgi:hypothetical protein